MTDENKRPDWYDESKLVSAILAFENGQGCYGGWVVDLGDGTCRLAHNVMLGAAELKFGDRVDLFYNPCDPLSRPWIGYRRYDAAPAGEQRGIKREPTPEQIVVREAEQKRRDEIELKAIRRNHESMFWELDRVELHTALAFMLKRCESAGIEIPAEVGSIRKDLTPLDESILRGLMKLAERGAEAWGGESDIAAACTLIEEKLARSDPFAMKEEPHPHPSAG